MNAPNDLGHWTELPDRVGQVLGTSPWLELDDRRVDDFIRATDHPRRPAALPFLLVSLVSWFQQSTFTVDGVGAAVNYGSDHIRIFEDLSAVTKLRAAARLTAFDPHPSGHLMRVMYEVEAQGIDGRVGEVESLALILAET